MPEIIKPTECSINSCTKLWMHIKLIKKSKGSCTEKQELMPKGAQNILLAAEMYTSVVPFFSNFVFVL